MVDKQITLRCDDGQEAVVFTKYVFSEDDINYEIKQRPPTKAQNMFLLLNS